MVLDALFGPAKRRFFFDAEVAEAVREIIGKAQVEVVLVSPYNDFWTHLKDEIHDARERGVAVHLICRKDEKLKDIAWLEKESVTVRPVERLHSKLYMNETTALVTSMNLWESSALNSKEICARFDGADRDALFEYALKLAGRSEAQSTQQTARVAPKSTPAKAAAKPAAPPPRSARKAAVASVTGYCIRCGDRNIAYNLDEPFCLKCFRSWNRFKDRDYPEEYCHRCGEERDTSMAKPLCRSCWRASARA